VLQGDTNSHFYHQFANGRRKNTIAFLNSEVGEIRGQREITLHIVEYYKKALDPVRNVLCIWEGVSGLNILRLLMISK